MKWYFYFILLCLNPNLKAQCGFTQPHDIIDLDNNDADTTNISLIVSGAINNSLADPNQGICGVELKFRHPFVKELFIELISPAGEKITLVGGNITAYNTALITWDVLFLPCADVPSPDLGFEPVWENDQDWLILTTYTGQYHPHIGCLEDFDIGNVNGTWTLRCIDFADFGSGKLLEANLIFCDDEGMTCMECKLDPGTILNPDIELCEGDDGLILDVQRNFPVFLPNTDVYSYEYVVFKDSLIYAYSVASDLRSYPSGTYQICGIQFLKNQASILPSSGQPYDAFSLDNYFFQSGSCASVSDSCMTVVIRQPPPVVNLLKYICSGDTFMINGQVLTTEGMYIITIENGTCDSIIKLELKEVKIQAVITADRDSLNCLNNTNTLVGSNGGTPGALLNYHWYSTGNDIEGDTTFFAVDAKKEGIYCLELTGQSNGLTCIDTICKEIFLDNSNPMISLTADTITCKKDTVSILLNAESNLLTHSWSSDDSFPFIQETEGIKIWYPGKYRVTVTSVNGCNVTDSIVVFENKIFNDPIIIVDTLTCSLDSVKITVTADTLKTFNYQWFGVPSEYMNIQNPYVFGSGVVTLLMEDNVNGCQGTYNISIPENKTIPDITNLSVDTINCNRISVNPVITSNVIIEKYSWAGPGLVSGLPNPDITLSGLYFVTITSMENGCSRDTSFMVEKDTDLPQIVLTADSITCLKDAVTIRLTSDKVLDSVKWTGPMNFTSQLFEPEVNTIGIYTVMYKGLNGCIGQEQITVVNGKDIPDATFIVDSIRCGQDTVSVRLEFAADTYEYLWNGPGISDPNIAQPLIFLAGIYTVTITNPFTGCIVEQRFDVIDDRIYTIPEFTVQPLDCLKDSVQIIMANTDIMSIHYSGPGFSSDVQSPFVQKEGIYLFTFTNQKNCISTGSVQVLRNDTIPVLNILPPAFKCTQDSVALSGFSSLAGTGFSWKGPDNFLKNGNTVYAYEGGSYIMVGTAPNSCKDSIVFSIAYDTIAPVFQIFPPDSLTCKKSSVTLSTNLQPADGFITWLPVNFTDDTLVVTSPGEYIAQATGLNLCTSSQSVIVIEDKTFPSFLVSATVIDCKDITSIITLTPTSDYTNIQWCNVTNPVPTPDDVLTFSTSFPGIYCFSIENKEGCIKDGHVEVVLNNSKPQILSLIQDTINCFNPTIQIGVVLDRNGVEFRYNGPGVVDSLVDSLLTISQEGSYYILVTGENFCKEDTVFNIVKSNDVPVFNTFTDTLTCDKGKINIGVVALSEITHYDWMGPDDFMSNSRTPIVFLKGEYKVKVTGSNGCISEGKVIVFQDIVKPQFSIPDTLLLPCDTSAIILSLTTMDSIIRYKWTFPTGLVYADKNPDTNIPGLYRIQITGQNGCPGVIDSFYVGVDTRPPGFVVTTDTITCKKPFATLVASSPENGVSYLWQSMSGQIFNTASIQTNEPGSYSLVVTNEKKCRDTLTLTLAIDTIKPTIIINKSGGIQCESKEVTLDATESSQGSSYKVKWSTINGNILTQLTQYMIDLDAEGLYTFEILNEINGCSRTETISVTASPQQFTFLGTEENAPTCQEIFNGNIILDSLNGTSPYRIIFNNVDQGSRLTYFNLSPGVYHLEVVDALGCRLEKTVTLTKGPDLNISIDPEFSILFGDSLLLAPQFGSAPNGTTNIEWISKDSIICIDCTALWVRPFVNTIYTIRYSIEGKCAQTVTVLVKVKNDINQAIPNIFAPSSATGNNLFYIPQIRGIDKINYIKIFDRWAENVFTGHDMIPGDSSMGWDGRFNGKDAVSGVYVVFAELVLFDGTVWQYQGDVMLLR
ncbi:MAG: gliding motility-associated C-terminal domain-containing protein [Saprospiraceae bacterium]|nr:gliding motility-associated C-terminal domain-containing protein [Saprospiraceae bacterium]